MVSLSFYRRQFVFFLALVGVGVGFGYLALEQKTVATGRPLDLPPGRDLVTMTIVDHGRAQIETAEVPGIIRFSRQEDEFSYLLLDSIPQAIPNLSVKVVWPRPVPIERTTVAAIIVHTDPAPWSWKWLDNQTLVYEFSKLDPAASVTLEAVLPKGVVLPSFSQRFFGSIQSLSHVVWLTLALVLPLLTLTILCFLLLAQFRKNRLSQTERVREQGPPTNLAPAAVTALLDGRVSARALAATIFDLARRDYLDIGRQGKSYVFTKRRRLLSPEASQDLAPYERALIEKLFPAGAAQVSEDDMRVRIGSSLFSKKVASIYLGIYAIVTQRGYFVENPTQIQGSYRLIGLIFFFFGLIGFGVGLALFADAPTPILFWVGMMLSALIMIELAPRLTNYTTNGLKARSEWLAFRNYLTRAQTITFTMQNQEEFFRYLPYAIALGVEVEWARRFLTAPFHLPAWYSSEARVLRLEDFVNDIFPMVGFLARELAAVKEPTLS